MPFISIEPRLGKYCATAEEFANIFYIGIYSLTIHNYDFQSFYGLIRVEHSLTLAR